MVAAMAQQRRSDGGSDGTAVTVQQRGQRDLSQALVSIDGWRGGVCLWQAVAAKAPTTVSTVLTATLAAATATATEMSVTAATAPSAGVQVVSD